MQVKVLIPGKETFMHYIICNTGDVNLK